MSIKLRIATRAIKNRLDAKEKFETIILDYPKLTEEDICEIRKALGIK